MNQRTDWLREGLHYCQHTVRMIVAVLYAAVWMAGTAAETRAQSFADVPSNYWAYSYIETLAASGISAGCGGGKYCPTAVVTRAQMAVFLVRGMHGATFVPPPATGMIFADVPVGSFAATFIEQLYRDRITSGCGNGNFCPTSLVTRDQMAVFLLRAKYGASYSPPPATGMFTDVPLAYWSARWIEQLAREGVTAGCGGGKFCPLTPVTRDQMAVFLVRTFAIPLVPTITLTGPTAAVAVGSTATLTWSAQNATSCTASGAWSGSKPTTGSAQVGPINQRSTYTLECTGSGGTRQRSVTIDVVYPPPTVSLIASNDAVRAGSTVTLTWNVTNATACSASGGWSGAKPVSGSEITAPITSTTTFNLICSGSGGDGSGAVTVAVNAVAGRILVPSISRSDSDVNDPYAPYASNDYLSAAQALPNPVVLGGYVNEALRGPDGRSYQYGDLDDIFVVNLAAGQVIELFMPSADPSLPDAERDDADLVLYDQNGSLVDASMTTERIEQLTVPANGTYYVRVMIWSGAPLYRLSIGQSSVAAMGASLRLSEEFVTGDAIVQVRKAPGDKGAEVLAQNLATRYAWRRKAGEPGRGMLVAMPAMARAVIESRRPAQHGRRAAGLTVPTDLKAKWDTLHYVKTLRSDASIRRAELNRIHRTQAVPNDPLYAGQRWHYEIMQLPYAWDITTGSPSVVVAVIDTGVVPHPDLVANLIQGYDFISNPSNSDGDGIDPIADDPGCAINGAYVFHGTHVAGTVAAATNNATGVAGVGGNLKIMPVRVLENCGGGTTYDIEQGIRYAAGLPNDSGQLPAQRASVINLSLGALYTCTASEVEVFAQARAQGVLVVAAAGNDNTSSLASPASCPGVISVSSIRPDRTRAYYSNYGASWVDVAAPGGDLLTDRNGDGRFDGILSTYVSGLGSARVPTYEMLQGTSMAAPHVAGIMGLMKSVNPNIAPHQVDDLLTQGLLTDDIGAPGPDELGIGLINALKAVRAASQTPPSLPPKLAISPTSLNFGDIGTESEVVTANGGGGTLSVTSIVRSAAWITVTALDANSNGLGRYRIGVERGALAPGVYEGSVDFVSTAGTVRVSVLMQVSVASGPPDAGWQYVMLLDASSQEWQEQVEVLTSGEATPYRFDAVNTGDFYVVAGTDMNNDYYICDEAEACGAYSSIGQPTIVPVRGEVSGIDFASVFQASVETATAASGLLSSEEAQSRRIKRR